jgi:hypothetical protein
MWAGNWNVLNNFFVFLITLYVMKAYVEVVVGLHTFLITAQW